MIQYSKRPKAYRKISISKEIFQLSDFFLFWLAGASGIMKPRKKSQTSEAEVMCRFMKFVCRQCFNRAQVIGRVYLIVGCVDWIFSALDTNYSIFCLSHEKNR